MSNKVKDIGIKNRTYYFFNGIIIIINFDPNGIKIYEKSYENILIYYNGHVVIKDSKFFRIISVNLYTLLSTK